MKSKAFCLQLNTKQAPEFIDITDWVCQCVNQSKVHNGFVVVYSKHTTAAVKINENEPLLLDDMGKFLEKICPRHGEYDHNNFEIRTVNMTADESPNGQSFSLGLLGYYPEWLVIWAKTLTYRAFCITNLRGNTEFWVIFPVSALGRKRTLEKASYLVG